MNLDNTKLIIIAGIVIFLAGFGFWLFKGSEPPTGDKLTDLGREHVPIGTPVEYNSNPPSSGSHYEEWTRAGVYKTLKDDRNLVHSLEHGYVIISYNCDKKLTWIPVAYAHGIEEESEASKSATATESAILSDEFRSEDCHNLVDQLISVYEKKGKSKLIVLPRPTLDSRVALTAWAYIDKFDNFDSSRIEKFIDSHRNRGPEQTIE